jgi:hypothetical protein
MTDHVVSYNAALRPAPNWEQRADSLRISRASSRLSIAGIPGVLP